MSRGEKSNGRGREAVRALDWAPEFGDAVCRGGGFVFKAAPDVAYKAG